MEKLQQKFKENELEKLGVKKGKQANSTLMGRRREKATGL